ncbi:MAG: sugar transferase [Deltaproteobacteria bacterium]|nr:sugar transferase [Deltaproteobacteria bacterium]
MGERAIRLPPAILGRLARSRATLSRTWIVGRSEVRRRAGPVIRRSFDAVVGCTGLLLATPVLGAAAVLVKLTSPGPVFFRQVRIGLLGQPIVVRKIRTMHTDAEKRLESLVSKNESEGGVTFKIRRDPRVTPVGRILRKLSIDELPQLWNLVEGSMTTFGPRPPIPREVALYGVHERRRLEVKPGLTCLWQVSGRSDLNFDKQVSLDIEYIDNATLADEARILLRTVPAVVSGKGAY